MRNNKKAKDILTHSQFEINKRCDEDTIESNDWLAANGLKTDSFFSTDLKLIQAQKQAHTLLKHHIELLSLEQETTLRNFQHLMTHKNTRIKLQQKAAIPVLNISSKIHRQLFKQYRKITKA
jgi:hypothetical protein